MQINSLEELAGEYKKFVTQNYDLLSEFYDIKRRLYKRYDANKGEGVLKGLPDFEKYAVIPKKRRVTIEADAILEEKIRRMHNGVRRSIRGAQEKTVQDTSPDTYQAFRTSLYESR